MNVVEVKRYPINDKLKQLILERDEFTCRYCGSKSTPFQFDHVYPVSKGGETTKENLVLACERCNREKGYGTGIYPKPIGHFKNRSRRMLFSAFILIFWNILGFLYIGSVNVLNWNFVIILILEIMPYIIAIYAEHDYISTGK